MTDNSNVAPATAPAAVEITPEAEPWRQRWEELTAYTMKYLVNRTDLYLAYRADGRVYTRKAALTKDVISRHFRPRTCADIIGVHSTKAEEIEGPDGKPVVSCTCKWVCVDIDHHGDGPAPAANTVASKAWHQRAADLGFRPLTLQSNGCGGYHLFIVFSEPIQAPIAHGFVHWLVRDWRELGLAAAPEVLPRQPKIRLIDDASDARGGCGNAARLPGRHHKREHLSRFWTGENTLTGHAAVDWMVDHTGDDPALIPNEARTFQTEHTVGKVRESTQRSRPKTFDDLALAADALRSLKPMAESYDTWVKVGMCLHELGDCGLVLWDEWSKTRSEKYEGEACQKKWSTFAEAHKLNGRDGLTLGSLFEFAKNQAGWKYPNQVDPPSGRMNSAMAPADWPEDPKPVRYVLPPVPALDPELIPAPLRPWLADIAARVGCALEFPVVGALTALGIVVGHKVVIRPKRHDDWAVTPNLWGAPVGPPGTLKTPAMKESIRPLRRLEAEAREAHAQALKDFKIALTVSQAQSDAAKAALKSAAKDNRPAPALETLARNAASIQIPDEPAMRRYSTADATVEALGELLASNPNGIGVVRDELTGWMRSLERQDQGPAKAFFLEAWEGTGLGFQYDRIGRGNLLIPNCVVTVLGGIQPGPLRAFLRWVAKGEEADDGLIARFSLAMWPDLSDWKNVDRWPDSPARNKAFEVFKRLDSLDPVKAGAMADPDGGSPFLRFTSPAQDAFDSWRDTLENTKLRAPDESSLVESHLAKYRKLMPALALLFHLADIADGRATGPVSLASAELAVKWCDILEAHARRIYSCVVEPDLEAARSLAEKIRHGALPSPFQFREVYRHGWAGLDDPNAARRAVGILQDLGWVRSVEIAQTGGAPREDIHIHPRLPRKPSENQNTRREGGDKTDISPG
jgi:putative DNA primase/helicase